jgi:hypothetical protein
MNKDIYCYSRVWVFLNRNRLDDHYFDQNILCSIQLWRYDRGGTKVLTPAGWKNGLLWTRYGGTIGVVSSCFLPLLGIAPIVLFLLQYQHICKATQRVGHSP